MQTTTVPVVNANDITVMNINGKESLWIDRGWRATDTDKDSGLSEAKLLGNANMQGNYIDGGTDYAEVDTRNLSTFYNCRKVCAVLPVISTFIEIYTNFFASFSHLITQLRTLPLCCWVVIHLAIVEQSILDLDMILVRLERLVRMQILINLTKHSF